MFSGDDISVEDAANLYDEAYYTAAVKNGSAPDVNTCKKIEEIAHSLRCRREDVKNFARDFQFIGVAKNAQNLEDARCGEKCTCLRDMSPNEKLQLATKNVAALAYLQESSRRPRRPRRPRRTHLPLLPCQLRRHLHHEAKDCVHENMTKT